MNPERRSKVEKSHRIEQDCEKSGEMACGSKRFHELPVIALMDSNS
jgi:hypothetical protein